MKRCATCGAANAEAAEWCGLCLTRFGQPSDAGPTAAVSDQVSGEEFGYDTLSGHGAPATSSVSVEVTASGIAVPAALEGRDKDLAGSEGIADHSQPPQIPNSLSAGIGLGVPSSEVASSMPESWVVSAAPRSGSRGSQASLSPQIGETNQLHGSALQRPAPVLGPRPPRLGGKGFLAKVERDPVGNLVLRCSVCEVANPIEVNQCTVCGTDFFAGLRQTEEKKDVPRNKALLWGMLPGGGFLALGKKARFVGHASLVIWLLALLIVLMALAPGKLLFFKVVFALMGAGVWAASALDAGKEASGEGESYLVDKRPLLVFAASVALLFVIGFVVTWTALRNPPEPAGGGQIYEVPSSPG